MPIELAKIQLNRVHKVETLEQASLVHHRVPGLEGNLTQDLGRDSVRLQIEGIFYGTKAKDNLETLRKAYKQRQPVDFLADVVGQAYFSQVVLERFEVLQSAQSPEQFNYRLTIAEFVPPKQSTAANQSAVNQAIAKQALALMDVAMLPDAIALGSIPALTNPVEPLKNAVTEVAKALEGIGSALEGLTTLGDTPLDAPPQDPTPLPSPPPLTWGDKPSLEAMLKAGLSVKNLRDSGVSVEDLLEAGVSVLDLQRAGVSADKLREAGVSQEDLAAAERAGEALDRLERSLWVTIAADEASRGAIANQSFEIRDAGGLVLKKSIFNAQGQAILENLPTGNYSLVLTGLDATDWEIEFVFWIEIVVETDELWADETFEIYDGDKRVTSGQLDRQGRASVSHLKEGRYTLRFPNREATEWVEGRTEDEPPAPAPEIGNFVTLEGDPAEAIANQAFEIQDAQGNIIQSARFDGRGQAQLRGLAAGNYRLVLRELEATDWEERRPEDEPPTPEPEISNFVTLEGEPANAIANQPFEIRDAEGNIVQSARFDDRGQAQLRALAVGDYTLVLTGLEAADWEPVCWIVIAIETEELQSFAQQRFEIRDENDEVVAEGQFNDRGWAYITELEEGRYRLVFVGQIEDSDWQLG